MRSRCVLFFVFFGILANLLLCAENFKLMQQWKHDNEILRRIFYSFVDKDNHVIGIFYMQGGRIITPDKVFTFAQRGQGPDNVLNISAIFPFNNEGDIAIVEMPDKVKIFKKSDNVYIWKENRSLQRGKILQKIRNGIFFDNKWFLAGNEDLERDEKKALVSLVKVLDDKGKALKNLLVIKEPSPYRYAYMNSFVVPFKNDKVFYLAENELKVVVISSKSLEILKEVMLEKPNFYKKMPEDFYIFKQNVDKKQVLIDSETWPKGYSQIAKVVVEDKYLVLQVRTCSEKLKNYALLFYNADSFKLEKTIYIDDFLLGARDGKYYFYANGNPTFDEAAEDCVINIYSFTDNK